MFKEIATGLRTMQPRRTKDSIGNRIYKGDYENRAFIEGGKIPTTIREKRNAF
jgi:hypothetical protein